MVGNRPDAWALLALPDHARFDGDTLSAKLRQLGLIDHGSVADDPASETWTCRFGALPFRLTIGIAAQAFLAEAAALSEPAGLGIAIVIYASSEPSCDTVDVAQQLCAVTALLAEVSGATSLYWSPARLWSPTNLLADAVAAMEVQSLPPVLHIVAFEPGASADGKWSLSTRGLGWLVGHEMTVNFPTELSQCDASDRVHRLVVAALVHRGLTGPMRVPGVLQGEYFEIRPADTNYLNQNLIIDCFQANRYPHHYIDKKILNIR